MSSEMLHEDANKLGPEVIDQHRAIVSLMEELEAVDWYNQRAKATGNPDLRAILEHNRDEEKEHAAMVLEWLRRGDPKFSSTSRPTCSPRARSRRSRLRRSTAAAAKAARIASSSDGSLGIGSLRPAKGGGQNEEPSFSR